MRTLIIILLLITNLSCNEKQSETKNRIESKVQENNDTSDFENEKILETLYVSAKSGLTYRKNPNGKILGNLPYGEKVHIIEYSGIENEIEDENQIIKGEWVGIKNNSNGKINKVYVFNSFLDNGFNVKLVKENLSLVQGYYSPKSEMSFYESGKEIYIDSLLNFQIISKGEFDELKKKNIDYINRDSTSIKRTNDTLIVGNHIFIDNEIDNDGYIKYKYIGSIDFLNKYVLFRKLWENADYILIDKLTGNIESENEKLIQLAREQGMNRLGLPRISINKKTMITLESSLYTKQAELNIFRIINDSHLKLELSLLFKTWSPNENDIFWISDDEFIVNASPIDVISEGEYGEKMDRNNFLKITIK